MDYTLGTETDENGTENYICKKCYFTTSHIGHWNRHLKTLKHRVTKDYTLGTKTDEKGQLEDKSKVYECACGKRYLHRQGLYKHKLKCTYEPPVETEPQNQLVSNSNAKDEVLEKEIKELRKLLTEQSTQMMVLLNTVGTVVQRVGNHNTISTNSHNTNIILQLNSNYPNALPIQYLIDQIKGNPKCVTHDPKLYAQAFIEALSQQTEDEKTVRAIKDTMYVKYEEIGFKEDKEVQVFDLVKKGTEQDQLCKAAQENSNMFSREKDSKEYPEMVLGITKDLTPCERKLIKKQVIKTIGSE
jgi:hypothetical protein